MSEEFRKYLIEFEYNKQVYYTVSGADLSDSNEAEKVLVDEDKKMLLFNEVSLIKQAIENKLFLFDNERLQEWSAGITFPAVPYARFNLDILISDKINSHSDPSLEEIYLVIGVIEDYAIQINDGQLIACLQSKLFRDFKEISADCYLWGVKDIFDQGFDFNTFLSERCAFYNLLKERIRIYA